MNWKDKVELNANILKAEVDISPSMLISGGEDIDWKKVEDLSKMVALKYDADMVQMSPGINYELFMSQSHYLFDIINNQYLTESKEVIRTWKERLFTRPWHPFVKTKIIQIPSNKVYILNNEMVCHPEIAEKIKKSVEKSI